MTIYNDHFGGAPKFMRNVFAGVASTRFHRPVPWSGGTRGLGDDTQRILRSFREAFTGALDWLALQPRPELLSSDDGVCLMAQPRRQYALGFDRGGSVKLAASALSASAELRWMNLHEGKWIDGGEVELGWISLRTTGPDQWAALILAR